MIILILFLTGGLFLITAGRAYLAAFTDVELEKIPLGIYGLAGTYILSGLLCIYPAWSLIKFGSLIRTAVAENNPVKFNKGFVHLKRFFLFAGIITVIAILLYVLVVTGLFAILQL